jgi:predicted transposase/invertase (TIGR01784 family)
MARYLDPKNDLTFKRIFGEHPALLINFLNAVMPFDTDRQIEWIEYLPSELAPDSPLGKDSIVDVRCRDKLGRLFIIEMQMFWVEAFTNRIVFNAGKAYVRQLGSGKEYHLLQPVYTLAILNKNFDHKSNRFYHHYQIVNRENTEEIIPGLEFVLVELTDKFRPETISDRKLMVLWLRFLKEVGEEMRSLPPEMQENEDIRQAAELCEVGAFSDAELAAYDKYWDNIRVINTLHHDANIKLEATYAEIKAKDVEIKAKDAEIEAKDAEIEAKDAEIEAKDAEIEAKDAEIEAKKTELEATQKMNEQQAVLIAELQRQLAGK